MCQVQLCLSVLVLRTLSFLAHGTVTSCCVLRSTYLPQGSGSQWHRALSITWVLPPRGPELRSHPRCSFPPHRRVLCQVPACWWREGLKCAHLQTNCWQRAFTTCCVAQETL